MLLILQAAPNTNSIESMSINIPSSGVPQRSTLSANSHSLHDYLLSCTPKSASDKGDEGHLVLPQKLVDINDSLTQRCLNVHQSATNPNQISSSETFRPSLENQEPQDHMQPDSHNSHNMNEETIPDASSETKLKNYSTMDRHLSLDETCYGFAVLSYMEVDKTHYKKLANFMKYVCDHLVLVIDNNKINQIKQTLESVIKIYNDKSEGSLETAIKDVQLQYEELKDMLENLSFSEPLYFLRYIDGILTGMQFQHCIAGPYSPYNLIQPIQRINTSTTSQTKCSIM